MGSEAARIGAAWAFRPVWTRRDSPLKSGVRYVDAGQQWPILNKESPCQKVLLRAQDAAGGHRSGCVTEPPQRQVPASRQAVGLPEGQILMESKKGVMPWRSVPSCRPTPH